MTVSAPFTCENGAVDELILIACLVTDKKFRKIGGADGRLQQAASKLASNILVKQVQPKHLLDEPGRVTESLLKHLLLDLPKTKKIQLKVVHKFNDFSEREDCISAMTLLESWLHSIHDTVYDNVQIQVFDPLPCIRLFYDRILSGRFIQNFCVSEGFEGKAFWPEFWSPPELAEGLCFPVIVKPVDACSREDSHWMTLLRNPRSQLVQSFSEEYLLQRFYAHFGVFYKIYVVGRSVNVVPRPSVSLETFQEESVRFNTAHFKASAADLTETQLQQAWLRFDRLRPEIDRFSLLLAERLNCSYFGADIIIPEGQEHQFAVIDINYLPGFDGVDELPRKFIDAIMKNF